MANNRIYIEGKVKSNEGRFIKKLINELFPENNLVAEIISIGGWTKTKLAAPKFIETHESGGKNLVILDADDDIKEPLTGGFEKRLNKIREDLQGYDYELYLFPNHCENGDFEVLLENCAHPNHKKVFDCFTNYERCLTGHIDPISRQQEYNIPIRKSRLYAYIDALPKSSDEDEQMKNDGNWLYDRPDIWDFNNPCLLPLKTFLLTHLS